MENKNIITRSAKFNSEYNLEGKKYKNGHSEKLPF